MGKKRGKGRGGGMNFGTLLKSGVPHPYKSMFKSGLSGLGAGLLTPNKFLNTAIGAAEGGAVGVITAWFAPEIYTVIHQATAKYLNGTPGSSSSSGSNAYPG